MRCARRVEAALQGSSGRDLVMVKADVVEAELAQLRLSLRTTKRAAGGRIMQGAYEEGHAAGLEFEYVAGLANAE